VETGRPGRTRWPKPSSDSSLPDIAKGTRSGELSNPGKDTLALAAGCEESELKVQDDQDAYGGVGVLARVMKS
jgi:hypothetical protein